jgi:hypothetical protein
MPETKLSYEVETYGHRWKKDKLGSVWSFDVDNHSCIECEDCGYTFCIFCKDIPDERCFVNDTKKEAIESLFVELGI